MENKKIILSCSDLSIGYDKPLAGPLNFCLDHNEVIHIKGRNGSGKTTLIQTLLGDIPKREGRYDWYVEKKSISYLPQISAHSNIFSYNVLEILDIYNISKDFYTLLPSSLLEKRWIDLSGGEKQKVILLTRIQAETRVLILDEPLNHLDQESVQQVSDFILNLQRLRDIAVIVVSHQDLKLSDIKVVELC